MRKLIPMLIIFLTQFVFSEGLENISDIYGFLAGNTFNTCAETEVQMEMKFFKDKSVTIVYKTDWWDDEKNKQEEFVKEEKGKYEILKNNIVKISIPRDSSSAEFLFGNNVNLLGSFFPDDGLIFLRKSNVKKDSVFSSMEGETMFFYKNGCQFHINAEQKELRKQFSEKLTHEKNRDLKALFLKIMDDDFEAIKTQLKQNQKLAVSKSYWGDTPLMFFVRSHLSLKDPNQKLNTEIVRILLKYGADPNAKETLTGFKNPASAKMFTGITEQTVLSLIENAGNFKNKKEIIDLLRQNGARE